MNVVLSYDILSEELENLTRDHDPQADCCSSRGNCVIAIICRPPAVLLHMDYLDLQESNIQLDSGLRGSY